jgi:hypothetical protein
MTDLSVLIKVNHYDGIIGILKNERLIEYLNGLYVTPLLLKTSELSKLEEAIFFDSMVFFLSGREFMDDSLLYCIGATDFFCVVGSNIHRVGSWRFLVDHVNTINNQIYFWDAHPNLFLNRFLKEHPIGWPFDEDVAQECAEVSIHISEGETIEIFMKNTDKLRELFPENFTQTRSVH